MAHATPMLEIIPSTSIDCVDGRTPVLAASYQDVLDNANTPNGVVVSDDDGKVTGRFFPSSDTAANINAVVPSAGEIMWLEDILLLTMGDGAFYGGQPMGLNSQQIIYVAGKGTAVQNGQSLYDAVTAAAARTPYGNALSLTNMVWVVLGGGIFDLRSLAGGNLVTPNFVGLHGLFGSAMTTILTDSTHRLSLTQPALGTTYYSYLHGLMFSSPTAGSSLRLTWALDGDDTSAPIVIDHEDLDFPGLTSSQSCHLIDQLQYVSTPKLQGRAKNCRTTGRGLYGRHTSTPYLSTPFTISVVFTDCSGGDGSFGGSSTTIGTHDGLLTGGLYNCTMFGTGTWAAVVNCLMEDCEWSAAIERVGTGAYIHDSIIRGVVSTYSIAHNASITCKHRNNALAGGIHSNITNDISGTIDAAGNLIGATDV